MISWHHIATTTEAAAPIAAELRCHLSAGERVLWLIPGGSGTAVAATVSHLLTGVPTENLTVMLGDERYGPVGHADSNWRQLHQQGFSLPDARLIPLLTGDSRDAATRRWEKTLSQELATADYRIGMFGIGVDGHTAGILPGSPAVTSNRLVAGYDAGSYRRITITTLAIAKLDQVFVYGVGEEKWPVLEQLSTDRPLVEQPAQALKLVSRLIVLSDFKGGS